MQTSLSQKLADVRRESEEREAQRRAQNSGLEYLDLRKAAIQPESLKFVTEEQARAAKLVPIEERSGQIALGIFDVTSPAVVKIVEELKSRGLVATLRVVSLSGLAYAWDFYRFAPHPASPIAERIEIDEGRVASLENTRGHLSEVAAAIGGFDFKTGQMEVLLEIIFMTAILNRASDIHFEPEEKLVRLRYRIDGLLHDIMLNFPAEWYHQVLARIKLLARLKLNIEKEPQDGRFTIKFPDGKEDEVRVSVIPSEFGETTVLRILYAAALDLNLEDLGLREDDLAIAREELQKPDGLILNTGPTGSGKTTTLYVFLRVKAKPEIKVVTIEKPIEYHLPGVEQTQVDEKAGFTFAAALKSTLRQDPDVILVGEINDAETAETAMQAALTGHLVFATVHANNAPAAIPRLLDLGIKPSTIGPAINLIIAQRLVRKLCVECRERRELSDEQASQIRKFLDDLPWRVKRPESSAILLFKAKGCPACGGLGYKGRVGIFELFLIDDKIESLVHEGASEEQLMEAAKKQGIVTVQQDGVLKALQGVTSLEEVEAVTGPLKLGTSF